MQLLNLSIDRIIIHQIFQRDQDGNKIAPTQSHEYTNFDHSAMQAFKSRVIDALGDGSKAVQMEIVNQESADLPTLIDKMIDQDSDSFAVSSYDIAKKLTNAQHRKSIPGGISLRANPQALLPSKNNVNRPSVVAPEGAKPKRIRYMPISRSHAGYLG